VRHAASSKDPWGFGYQWSYGDTTPRGAGLSVMASEAYYLTQDNKYDTYSQRWLANILGTNVWGSSFIVGAGSTFPNCIQHQVENLAGALDGASGRTLAAKAGNRTCQQSLRICPLTNLPRRLLRDTFSGFMVHQPQRCVHLLVGKQWFQ
jgi:hypothetical protein